MDMKMQAFLDKVKDMADKTAASFTSKLFLCTVSKGYFLPVFDITKNIDIVFSRLFHITCFFQDFHKVG